MFRYERRELSGRKSAQILCRSDLLIAAVQAVGDGGETNLHVHNKLDGFWFVLRGRATFYTTDDEVVGVLGPLDGVLIPRGFPYWFESTGDETLEILQVEASSAPIRSMKDVLADRVDLDVSPEIAARQAEVEVLGAES